MVVTVVVPETVVVALTVTVGFEEAAADELARRLFEKV